MKYLIFLFTSISVFSQSSGDLSGYYDVSFQLIQREIASAYNQKSSTFTGSKYFYKNHKKFKIINFALKKKIKDINLSIDTKKDFQNIKKIIKHLNDKNISLKNIIKIRKKIDL